jgi:hypothetical protein
MPVTHQAYARVITKSRVFLSGFLERNSRMLPGLA